MTTTTVDRPAEPTLGQMAYEAYCAQIGSVAMQPWGELGEPVRQAWYEASIAVVAWTWKKQYRALVEKWEESIGKGEIECQLMP